jgi:hypothetical protein
VANILSHDDAGVLEQRRVDDLLARDDDGSRLSVKRGDNGSDPEWLGDVELCKCRNKTGPPEKPRLPHPSRRKTR